MRPIKLEIVVVCAPLQDIVQMRRAKHLIVVGPEWPPLYPLHGTASRLALRRKVFKLEGYAFLGAECQCGSAEEKPLDSHTVNVEGRYQDQTFPVAPLPLRFCRERFVSVVIDA